MCEEQRSTVQYSEEQRSTEEPHIGAHGAKATFTEPRNHGRPKNANTRQHTCFGGSEIRRTLDSNERTNERSQQTLASFFLLPSHHRSSPLRRNHNGDGDGENNTLVPLLEPSRAPPQWLYVQQTCSELARSLLGACSEPAVRGSLNRMRETLFCLVQDRTRVGVHFAPMGSSVGDGPGRNTHTLSPSLSPPFLPPFPCTHTHTHTHTHLSSFD